MNDIIPIENITALIYLIRGKKVMLDRDLAALYKTIGPGLLESVYQKCLSYELEKAGHEVVCEKIIPINYDAIEIDMGFRADMIVDDQIIIENKTVEKIMPIHEAQLLSYLKATGLTLGFLLNWNVTLMKDGIKRMVFSIDK